jgi:hypothetical protein
MTNEHSALIKYNSMRPYTTVAQIKSEFGIRSDDPNEIKKHLKRIIKEIHPDANHHQSPSSSDQERFENVMAALAFLDQGFSMVPTVQLHALSRYVENTGALVLQEKQDQKFEDKRNQFLNRYRSSTLFPKISSASIVGLLSLLWMFPSTIDSHPVLSKYSFFSGATFGIVWLSSICVAGYYWLFTRYSEQRLELAVKRLDLDSVQEEIFDSFVQLELTPVPKGTRRKKNETPAEPEKPRFTKDALIVHITELSLINLRYRPSILRNPASWFLRPALSQNVSFDLATLVAESIISKAVGNNLITPEKAPGLALYYIYEGPIDLQ